MKPGLELPIPGRKLLDLRKVGQCLICHAQLFSWESDEPRQTCADFGLPTPHCEHPDDICDSKECREKRRRYYQGKRKIKNPCEFPRLRDKVIEP